jgi:AcrR family transcriptional regulator
MLRERFEAASSGPGDGAARILAIAGAYLGFHQEEPERFALLAQCEAFRPDGPSQDPDTAPSALQEHHDAIMGVMVEALRAGKKDGSLQQDLGDPLATAYCLWGMVHGLIQLQATKSATLDRDLGRRGSRLAWEGVHLIRLAIETRRPRRMRLT